MRSQKTSMCHVQRRVPSAATKTDISTAQPLRFPNMETLRNLVFISALALCLAACTNEEASKRVLEQQGYHDIKFTGYRAWAGSKDDLYRTGFEATSVVGVRVSGAVTGGPLKGYTIRVD